MVHMEWMPTAELENYCIKNNSNNNKHSATELTIRTNTTNQLPHNWTYVHINSVDLNEMFHQLEKFVG